MKIWSMDKLPYDSYRICPLKAPGGAIVFSSNAILFIDHSSKYRLSLNSYGDFAETDPDVIGKFVFEKSKDPISLDDAKYTFLSDSVALLSLETGALYFMTILSDGRSVTHIDLASAGSSIVTTGMCTLNERYFFVAARLANSVLSSYMLRMDEHHASHKRAKDDPAALDSHSFGQLTDWCEPKDLDENVIELLSEIRATKASKMGETMMMGASTQPKYDLRTVDTIVSVAPLVDVFLRPKDYDNDNDNDSLESNKTTDPGYIPMDNERSERHRKLDPDAEFDLVAACGYERSGAIALISKTMPHAILDTREAQSVMGVWSLFSIPDETSSISNTTNSTHMDVTDKPHTNPSSENTKKSKQGRSNGDGDKDEGDKEDDLPGRQQSGKRSAPDDLPKDDGDDANDGNNEVGGNEDGEGDGEGTQEEQEQEQDYERELLHKVVLVTSPQSTRVLVVNDDGSIGGLSSNETPKPRHSTAASAATPTGFLEKDETLCAGNVYSGHRMLQVCYYEMVLVDSNLQQTQQLSFGTDSDGNDLYAVWCSILDPYVLLLLSDHQLVMYEASNLDTMLLEKSPMPIFDAHNAQSSTLATIHLFTDTSNMIGFNTLNAEGKQHQQQTTSTSMEVSQSGFLNKSLAMSQNGNGADDILNEEEALEMAIDTTELELYGNAKDFSSRRSEQRSLLDASDKNIMFNRSIHSDFLDRYAFFAVAREDGQFEIWKLPESSSGGAHNAHLVFRCSNLHNGRQIMDHENEVKKSVGGTMDGEICIASVGSQHSLPFLIVKLDDGSVFAYSCHYYKSALVSEKYLPIRFVRVPINLISHNLPLDEHSKSSSSGSDQGEQHVERPEMDANLSVLTVLRRSLTHPTITAFYGLAGRYNGFFVAGDSPMWLFCERDYLRAQRVSELKDVDRRRVFGHSVSSFCPLNIPSCSSGFIYTSNGMMHMSSLDAQWDVEFSGGGLCALRVPLKETVHAISYDRENHYIIVTTSSREKEMLRYLRGAADDKKEADLARKIAEGTAQPLVYDESTLNPRLPPIWEDVYTVKVIDPDTWECVAAFACGPEEVATAKFMNLMNYIPLPSTDPTPAAVLGTTFAAKRIVAPYKKIPVLVIGTSIVRGEDAACKGRIIVLDVISDTYTTTMATSKSSKSSNSSSKSSTSSSSSSFPSTSTSSDPYSVIVVRKKRSARLELRTERMCLQPITSLAALDGHLLTAEGRSFYVYQIRVEEGLYRIGFIDAQLSTVSVTVIRNFVLFGDVHHSIRLLRWLKAPHNWLQLVAKDPNPLDAVGTGAIIEGDKATLLATDERGNLYMHAFTPSSNPEIVPALEPVGDFHYGSRVKCMERFRVGALPKEDGSSSSSSLRNHGCILAGQDGSIGYIMPVNAQLFQILKKLESHLVSSLEHSAGLHPFAYRYPKPTYRMAHPHNKAILDGDLLWSFLHLERTKQEELARAIQVPAIFILDCLARFSMQSTF